MWTTLLPAAVALWLAFDLLVVLMVGLARSRPERRAAIGHGVEPH
jgi:hypothetical protein